MRQAFFCVVVCVPYFPFFQREDWIPVPADWSSSIVQGKGYATGEPIGNSIWKQVEALLPKYQRAPVQTADTLLFMLEDAASPAYGKLVLTKVRLGQGAFRVLVTDAYSKRPAGKRN